MSKNKKTQTKVVKKAVEAPKTVPSRIENMDDVNTQAPIDGKYTPDTPDLAAEKAAHPFVQVNTAPVAESTSNEIAEALKEMRETQQRMAEQEARLIEKERQLDQKLKEDVANLKPMSPDVLAAAQAHHETKVERMKKNLAKQEVKSIMIPLGPKEKLGSTLPVTLNGYRLNIPKGIYVDVPMQVAQIVADSQNQTIRAGENIRLDVDNLPEALL